MITDCCLCFVNDELFEEDAHGEPRIAEGTSERKCDIQRESSRSQKVSAAVDAIRERRRRQVQYYWDTLDAGIRSPVKRVAPDESSLKTRLVRRFPAPQVSTPITPTATRTSSLSSSASLPSIWTFSDELPSPRTLPSAQSLFVAQSHVEGASAAVTQNETMQFSSVHQSICDTETANVGVRDAMI